MAKLRKKTKTPSETINKKSADNQMKKAKAVFKTKVQKRDKLQNTASTAVSLKNFVVKLRRQQLEHAIGRTAEPSQIKRCVVRLKRVIPQFRPTTDAMPKSNMTTSTETPCSPKILSQNEPISCQASCTLPSPIHSDSVLKTKNPYVLANISNTFRVRMKRLSLKKNPKLPETQRDGIAQTEVPLLFMPHNANKRRESFKKLSLSGGLKILHSANSVQCKDVTSSEPLGNFPSRKLIVPMRQQLLVSERNSNMNFKANNEIPSSFDQTVEARLPLKPKDIRPSGQVTQDFVDIVSLEGTSLVNKSIEKCTSPHSQRNLSLVNESKEKKSISPQSRRDLSDKSEIIEQILLSENDEQVRSEVEPHINCELQTKADVPIPARKVPYRQKKTRQVSLRLSKTQKERNSIYEFLSQSQNSSDSGTNKDPADDIIKKLISQGRVHVSTHKKGSGKLVLKRNRKKTNLPSKAKKEPKDANAKNLKKIVSTQTNNIRNAEKIDSIQTNNIRNAEKIISTQTNNGNAEKIVTTQTNNIGNADDIHFNDDDDFIVDNDPVTSNREKSTTFSNMARTVLINQAGKNELNRKIERNPLKLIEAVKKYVSTPIRRKAPPVPLTVNFSPICQQIGKASPWRVDDEKLPHVFYFSRNTSNLPSFSSDYIPSTPRKQKPSSHITNNNEEEKQITVAALETRQSLSSFSSNDSNIENNPPPMISCTDENASIIDKRQQNNPRRALSYRSPLKAINILEVITLQPLKSYNNNTKKNETAKTSASQKLIKSCGTTEKNTDSNLFGFEEFLDDSDEISNGDQKEQDVALANSTLKNKLQNLRQLRPKVTTKQNVLRRPMRAVFDEGEGMPRQKNIKEIFCSTMINPPRDSDLPTNATSENGKETTENEASYNITNLFKDPEEPVFSIDVKNTRRTYVRTIKRKRKPRHDFIMFHDSDESGSDEEERSHERDTSDDVPGTTGHTKKRQKTHIKPTPELDKFVKEFNEMCHEVEQYQMVVERSN